MTWFREFSLLELVFIGAFVLLYLLYILRIRRLARFFKRRGYLVWVKFILRSTYFALLLLALLGPSFGDTKKEIKSVGKDILLVVDLSRSMDATDVQPSRLQKAVYELSQMVRSLSSDRIGLVVFSSEAFMQCPLTFDQSALLLFLQSLNTSLLSGGGTDIGAALELATKKLTPSSTSDKYTKAIVLVTDGEDFGDRTEQLALQLSRYEVELLVLGVGTEEGSTIPTARGLKRDEEGQPVHSRLNTEQLQQLTRKAGGSFFQLSDTRNDTPRLIRQLDQMKGQMRATKTVDVAANKYVYPLLAALLLIVLDVLITLTVIKV